MKKKLVFKKQTLHALAGEALQNIYGGHWGTSGASQSAPSGCNCTVSVGCPETAHTFCPSVCNPSRDCDRA